MTHCMIVLMMPLNKESKRLLLLKSSLSCLVNRSNNDIKTGLFSVAFATHLTFGKSDFKFKQGFMRQHLIKYFEKQHISVFP